MKKWTIDELESLENKILELFHTTDLSAETLADCMGKIDTERYKLNQANVDNTESQALHIDSVMPRYYVDERAGCAAVRDREHPKFNKDYRGLHHDTSDVVEYKHGRTEGGTWIVDPKDLEYLHKLCKDLNGA